MPFMMWVGSIEGICDSERRGKTYYPIAREVGG